MTKAIEITLNSDLGGFFYSRLKEINDKSQSPIPQEMLYYSSHVLERFSNPEYFFDNQDGKVSEKILGVKLLETQSLDGEVKKRELKDIGETALVTCGYFPTNSRKKLVDSNYYIELGRVAYSQLNNIEPNYMNIDCFYKSLANSFNKLTSIINILAADVHQSIDLYEKYLVISQTTQDED